MLHRFLFVAGMTVGVMTPLIWAAYGGRPPPHAAHTPTEEVADVAPGTKKPPRVVAEDVTASIAPAPAAIPAPPPKPNASPRAIAPSHTEPVRSRPKIAHVARRHRIAHRSLPAVVERYNGAHIITVCAALTENEQLRAGCP